MLNHEPKNQCIYAPSKTNNMYILPCYNLNFQNRTNFEYFPHTIFYNAFPTVGTEYCQTFFLSEYLRTKIEISS